MHAGRSGQVMALAVEEGALKGSHRGQPVLLGKVARVTVHRVWSLRSAVLAAVDGSEARRLEWNFSEAQAPVHCSESVCVPARSCTSDL